MDPNSSFSSEYYPNGCKFKFIHSDSSNLSYAYSDNEDIIFSININRIFFLSGLRLVIFDHSLEKTVFSGKLTWYGASHGYDEYRVKIKAADIGKGLYFASVKMLYMDNELTSVRCGEELLFSEKNSAPDIQLTVSSFDFEAPKHIFGGIIYHVFVDRFAKGGNYTVKPGSVLVEDWSFGIPEYPQYPGAPLKNNTFYGGTLDGVISKLDYIQSLGANIIYLSPIFDAASNHKYDTADYMNVDSMFGGKDALARLISECHKRGMYLILDGVFNHTGADSIYFNRYGTYDSIGAYQSENSPYFNWYEFEKHPNKYKSWWGIEILPRLNTGNPDCKKYFLGEGGVVDTYTKMGIDGLRLDVVDELSDDFVASIKNILSQNGNGSVLYGEVWEDASNKIAYNTRKQYYLGSELDGVMNYPLRRGLIEYFTRSDIDALSYALTDIIRNAPQRITNAQMNLIGTHDTERILTVLGGDSPFGKKNSELAVLRMSEKQKTAAVKKLMALYTVLATLPGIPAIFYGDEAGLEGYSDPFNRMPYPWGKEENKLLSHYKRIGNIRRNNSVYKDGSFKLLRLDKSVLVFMREKHGRAYLTVYNNSDTDISVEFSDVAIKLIKKSSNKDYTVHSNSAEIFKTKAGANITLK